jgi:hypothetical protein
MNPARRYESDSAYCEGRVILVLRLADHNNSTTNPYPHGSQFGSAAASEAISERCQWPRFVISVTCRAEIASGERRYSIGTHHRKVVIALIPES